MAKRSAYASAGVDLAVSNRLKDDLPALLASTQRPEVLGQVGGFGGLFRSEEHTSELQSQ